LAEISCRREHAPGHFVAEPNGATGRFEGLPSLRGVELRPGLQTDLGQTAVDLDTPELVTLKIL